MGSNGQYILNKTTNEWETKTWTGSAKPMGGAIWTDGVDIYCSGYGENYILDKTTGVWSNKTWNNANLNGHYVWTDGVHLYCSNGATQYQIYTDNIK